MDADNWIPTATRRPERGLRVDWLCSDGTVVKGGTYDRLWFLPDGVYVYYDPLMWRPAT